MTREMLLGKQLVKPRGTMLTPKKKLEKLMSLSRATLFPSEATPRQISK
jgi:hypothetical protein